MSLIMFLIEVNIAKFPQMGMMMCGKRMWVNEEWLRKYQLHRTNPKSQ